jgi:hypothetical protein
MPEHTQSVTHTETDSAILDPQHPTLPQAPKAQKPTPLATEQAVHSSPTCRTTPPSKPSAGQPRTRSVEQPWRQRPWAPDQPLVVDLPSSAQKHKTPTRCQLPVPSCQVQTAAYPAAVLHSQSPRCPPFHTTRHTPSARSMSAAIHLCTEPSGPAQCTHCCCTQCATTAVESPPTPCARPVLAYALYPYTVQLLQHPLLPTCCTCGLFTAYKCHTVILSHWAQFAQKHTR